MLDMPQQNIVIPLVLRGIIQSAGGGAADRDIDNNKTMGRRGPEKRNHRYTNDIGTVKLPALCLNGYFASPSS